MIPAFGLRHDRDMLELLDILPRLAGSNSKNARIRAAGIARFYPD
jgi:hypothetical protein